MADLNALIAQGPEFYAPPDPFAQYAKMQQLEQASSTNQLNRMKMEDYRRKADVTNRLGALDPAAADYLAQIKRIDPKLGFDLEEQSIKSKNLGFTGTEIQTKIEETKRKLLDSSMRNMASNPSDENIIAHTQDYELNSLFANELPSIKATAKRLLAMTPEQRKAVLSGAGATAGDLSTAESSRLGRLTTERGQDLTAATAKAGQAVTMRGQNLTNQRALDALTQGKVPTGYRAVAGGGLEPIPGGPATGDKPLNESQGNATAFGMRMFESNNLLNNLEKAGTTSGGRIKGAVEGTLTSLVPFQGERLAEGAGAIMNVLPGFLGGPNAQQQSYDQAKRNFITAVLRKESGAAIAASEFANEEKKYFPQAGEDDTVIKQKQKARKLAIEAMKIQAGPGAKNIGASTSAPVGSNPNDPLNLGF